MSSSSSSVAAVAVEAVGGIPDVFRYITNMMERNLEWYTLCVVVRAVIRVCVCICEPCDINAHLVSERA